MCFVGGDFPDEQQSRLGHQDAAENQEGQLRHGVCGRGEFFFGVRAGSFRERGGENLGVGLAEGQRHGVCGDVSVFDGERVQCGNPCQDSTQFSVLFKPRHVSQANLSVHAFLFFRPDEVEGPGMMKPLCSQ